jgi:hypothetical protein
MRDPGHTVSTASREQRTVYTQLLGRVFNRAGTNYLVLTHDSEAPDWLWVRSVNARRERVRLHRDDILRCLPELAVTATLPPVRAGSAS